MEQSYSHEEAAWIRRLSAGDVVLYLARNNRMSQGQSHGERLYLRPYQPQDHAAILSLHRVALEAVGAYTKSGDWDSDLKEIEKSYPKKGGPFLVGVLNGQVIAMGALRRTSPERGEIRRMRVLPSLQRRGFGQAMLTALEQEAMRRGYAVLHLDTTILQVAAQKLYLKNGYQEVGRITHGVLWETIFYEKRLYLL